MNPIWCLMPVRNQPERTLAALSDLLAQTVPTQILIVAQGVDQALRELLEQTAEASADRIFLWSCQPALPSLSAVWNRGLSMIWQTGATEALVVNNDVRLNPVTIGVLQQVRSETDALFVSAVGVQDETFQATEINTTMRGGPDFSCFLITRAGHEKYRFDENFIPCFCEDLDMHRRYMLGGDGSRIFSINLPYLHYASQTLRTMDPAERETVERQIDQNARAYYARKWGGPVNQERFLVPFQSATESDEATTPYLQAHPPARRGGG
jgi:hypothetical protein